jgi:hypothetical protein
MRRPAPALANLPYRGDGAGRPGQLPLPPGRMPLVRGRRPLKRWRYVGVYGDDLMICAGSVRIAGIPQSFWAVWDRRTRELHERTALRDGGVDLGDGRLRVRDRNVEIDLDIEPTGDAVEVVSPHGAQYIWTRKQVLAATGTVKLGGAAQPFAAAGILDDTAGYFARSTTWSWSAGVGSSKAGAALAWNLVEGVHDAPIASERTLWIDGAARELGPVSFSAELDRIDFVQGGALAFAEESVRRRQDNFLLVASDYVQPFGTFAGSFPGNVEIADGFGVMEWHDARW